MPALVTTPGYCVNCGATNSIPVEACIVCGSIVLPAPFKNVKEAGRRIAQWAVIRGLPATIKDELASLVSFAIEQDQKERGR